MFSRGKISCYLHPPMLIFTSKQQFAEEWRKYTMHDKREITKKLIQMNVFSLEAHNLSVFNFCHTLI
jgi:hypothetical protein